MGAVTVSLRVGRTSVVANEGAAVNEVGLLTTGVQCTARSLGYRPSLAPEQEI